MDHLLKILSNNADDESQSYFTQLISETDSFTFMKILKDALNIYEGKQKRNRYFLTVTLDPKLHPQITPDLENRVEALIRSQIDRTALGLLEFAFCKEHHKNGRPHWHIHIISNKNLKKDFFKTFSRNFGHLDFSKSKSEQAKHAFNYLLKEGDLEIMM